MECGINTEAEMFFWEIGWDSYMKTTERQDGSTEKNPAN